MGVLIKADQPCPCGEGRSSLAIYDDGPHCFKCDKKFPAEDSVKSEGWHAQYLPWRGITADTMRFYEVKTMVAGDVPKEIHFDSGKFITRRLLPEKKFLTDKRDAPQRLLGQNKFPAGGAQAITICEGGVDTLSAFQMQGSKYPVVGVISASSARKECEQQHEYLNSFDKIYICLDNDEAGHKAASEVAGLFDPNKVHIVKLDLYKDCNEYLEKGDTQAFMRTWWAAKPWQPEGIISSFADIWDTLSKKERKPLVEFPWKNLQEMTYGIFEGQFILIKAPEKVGKTEFISHIEDQVLTTTDYNIGVIHIEDAKDQVIKRYAGYEMGKPCHLPDSGVTPDEIFEAYKTRVQREDRVHIYSHFGSNDPKLFIDMVRYLVTVRNCKLVFLDHFTQIVSGLLEKDERPVHDYLATTISTLSNDLQFAFVGISHVNDDGQTRGSRYYQKAPDLIIDLSRNKQAEDDIERNTLQVSIEGNRLVGLTGPAEQLYFNRASWRLEAGQPRRPF